MRAAILSILIVLSVSGFAGAAQVASPSAGYAQDARVLVYPNPAKDRIYVKGTAAVRIEIINMIGDIVLHEDIAGGMVSLTDMQPGLYIVRIYDADDTLILSSRLTKQ